MLETITVDDKNVIGVGLYNHCLTGWVSKTLNNVATDADHVPSVLIFNEPIILEQRSPDGVPRVYSDGITPTLNTCGGGREYYASVRVICIEMTSTKNTIVTDEICPTLTSRMGTGGNQVNAVFTTK